MGCCCSNVSDSETIEENKDEVNNESYENPLMQEKARPATYGATSEETTQESIERYTEDDREKGDGDSSTAVKSDTDISSQETHSHKGKNIFKKSLKKILRTKNKKEQNKSTLEKQYEGQNKKTPVLTYQDIGTLREQEKQKRAQTRAKDLEAKMKSKAMSEALKKAHERGEKLGELQEATAELRENSENFAETARKIAEREERKHLGKKSKKKQEKT